MKPSEAHTDKQLLEQMHQGDHRAFTELYNRYWPVLWRYASQAMKSQEDAQDIVQEVFATLWEKRNTIQISQSLQAYLYRSVLNRVIDQSHKTKYAATYLHDLKATYQEGDYTTDNLIHEKELIQKFEAGLNELPTKMRTIFEQSRLEQKTHQEISDELGISRDNVNRQIKNALIVLKKRLLSVMLFF
ncbi:RNA polymerase sigma-70 factor, ECF subfamily [bacterium A37T11]|nr:RNA polymerase sigma-70 factor, ECF subfamily [bacterium A37T11]